MSEGKTKRHSEETLSMPLKRCKDNVSSEEVWQLLNDQWRSPLPDTSVMFPWLHGDTQSVLPEKYTKEPTSSDFDRFQVSVIRSTAKNSRYIENSGLLKSSLEVSDLLLPCSKEKSLEAIISDLLKPFGGTDKEVMGLIRDCTIFQMLPILLTDPFNSVYNTERNTVRNNYQQWRQPNMFRRFDLQASAQFHLCKQCIVYCTGTECQCENLINVLRWSRKLSKLPECRFRILRGDITEKLWGTPHILLSSLESKSGLCSEFDIATFKNWDRDMYYTERLEVGKMSSATKVEDIWCGNSTDAELWKLKKFDNIGVSHTPYYDSNNSIVNEKHFTDSSFFNLPSKHNNWKLFIGCFENAQFPTLEILFDLIHNPKDQPHWLSFPSSGSIGLGNLNLDSIKRILNTCHLLHAYPYEKLLFCPDGYTESSFLTVAYLMYKIDKSLDEVIMLLHREYNRPFFLFLIDIQVLAHLEAMLRQYSPKNNPNSDPRSPLDIDSDTFSKIFFMKPPTDSPFLKCKGPLPSRILPHLYLGSLKHAQCPEMLRELGIKNIVSVGESVSWCRPRSKTLGTEAFLEENKQIDRRRSNSMQDAPTGLVSNSMISIVEHDGFNVCHIENLGDNGMDPMLHQLDMILDFIDECYKKNEKVFVHCMVGVSRSATVCIAECMKRLNCGLLKAYLYVRVRRLNIIIQPSLMFVYELLKWQEIHKPDDPDVIWDWNMICRCISQLNSNYIQ